jgi:hypothetical protein
MSKIFRNNLDRIKWFSNLFKSHIKKPFTLFKITYSYFNKYKKTYQKKYKYFFNKKIKLLREIFYININFFKIITYKTKFYFEIFKIIIKKT